MSRTGIEEKPPWQSVPAELKQLIAEALGAPVIRGVRVWGSYGPGPSFRLLLADGNRFFVKGLWPGSNEFQRTAFLRELRSYRELDRLLAPYAPRFFGEVSCDEWRMIVLEDLGPKSAPPWTVSRIVTATHGLAGLHSATAGVSLPEWVPELRNSRIVRNQLWQDYIEKWDLEQVARLSAGPGEALQWLEQSAPVLARASESLPEASGPHSLLHVDVRSDNLRVVDGRLRLFDWPFAHSGPAELDAVGFAQTVEAEGGASSEQVLQWYGEAHPLRDDIVTGAVATLSGFFARQAGQPEVPGLPRLRQWQREQLKVTLCWAAKRLDLPEPCWVESIR